MVTVIPWLALAVPRTWLNWSLLHQWRGPQAQSTWKPDKFIRMNNHHFSNNNNNTVHPLAYSWKLPHPQQIYMINWENTTPIPYENRKNCSQSNSFTDFHANLLCNGISILYGIHQWGRGTWKELWYLCLPCMRRVALEDPGEKTSW